MLYSLPSPLMTNSQSDGKSLGHLFPSIMPNAFSDLRVVDVMRVVDAIVMACMVAG